MFVDGDVDGIGSLVVAGMVSLVEYVTVVDTDIDEAVGGKSGTLSILVLGLITSRGDATARDTLLVRSYGSADGYFFLSQPHVVPMVSGFTI